MRFVSVCGCACTLIMALSAHAGAPDSAAYHVAREVPVAGDGGWDFLGLDARRARLYVTRGDRVQVLDTRTLAPVGEIPDTPGAHGVAIAADLNRGYVTAGRAAAIVVFELDSMKVLQRIAATGEGPDAIAYDSFTHRVFSFNARGRNATAIDARNNEVVGTIALDAKPESAVSDGAGRLYVNLEDTNSIAVVAAGKLAVERVWKVDGCEGPTGLALDRANHRLFSVCGNRVMAVMDATSGRVLATLPIGARVDGAEFDPGTGLAFASAGDGTLTVVREETPGKFSVARTVATKPGARTMVLDEKTHRVFLVTAGFGPTLPATAEVPHPHPTIIPGSFEVLVVER